MGRGSRNNVLAGMLLLSALVASVVVLSLLGGFLERLNKEHRTIRFELHDGVTGLKSGSEVRIGGLKVGMVAAVRPVPRPAGEDGPPKDLPPLLMEVDVRIDKDLAGSIRTDATALLETALLGGGSVINFVDLGKKSASTRETILMGKLAPPGFLAAAGYGDEQANQLKGILRNTDEGVKMFKNELATFGTRREKWYDDFDGITTSGRTLFEQDIPRIRDDISRGVDDAKAFLARARELIENNSEKVNQFIESARSAGNDFDVFGDKANEVADWVRATVMPAATELLTTGRDKVFRALDTANCVLSENAPVVRNALAKFKLSGDQLAATLAEVRRSPWRLIYRPDTRDLEFELLYDSARMYAQAVSELQSSAEALKGLSDSPSSATDAGRRSAAELLDKLRSDFEKYQEAEGEFMNQLKRRVK